MKKITLCAINARFSHSSLALLCLTHAASHPEAVTAVEFNINDSPEQIADSILRTLPDMAAFSCCIWNVCHVEKVASIVKKVRPQCLIVLGGPEVSFDGESLMARWPFVDIIIRGAGELPFAALSAALESGEGLERTPSATIRTAHGIVETPDAPFYELSAQPFLYDDLTAFENRMIYYETSRGCPFRCAYCMSAGERLSFLPVERVMSELELFMRENVQQVKLVDRTFNHPDSRARQIWAGLIALKEKYPHSSTNFHFEVSASLLSEETIALLSRAPRGLMQLEVGIQSTHDETLGAINRGHNTQKLLRNTAELCRAGRVRVYVDLIAGLPHETPETFAQSFNDAFSVGADRLQLGFLKLLPGSQLRVQAKAYGIVYTDHAPYQVLRTNTMPYESLRRLHHIEQVLDILYNSCRASQTLELLIPLCGSPYGFFDAFTAYLEERAYFSRPQQRTVIFEELFAFAREFADECRLYEALAHDWLCRGKPGPWPRNVSVPFCEHARDFLPVADNILRWLPHYQSLKYREIERRCVFAKFDCLFGEPARLLFDYGKAAGEDGFVQRIQ